MVEMSPNINWLRSNDGKTVVLSFRRESFAVTVTSVDGDEVPVGEPDP